MQEPINVLSVFDGDSCGQIALQEVGVLVGKYYASEIKSYAMNCTQKNFPNTIQLGDINNIDIDSLPKINLFIGGSPCQDLSGANKVRNGLEGEKSKLFYAYLCILNKLKEKNPDLLFLLENVKMTKQNEDIITELLGVKPILIDSKLVSASYRKRNYWTNIKGVTQPIDKNIKLQDILDNGYTDKEKGRCLLESDSRPLSTPVKMFHRYYSSGFTTLVFKDKNHFIECKSHYDTNFKGKPANEIIYTGDVYNGVRYLNKRERERIQNMPIGYTDMLTENQAACVLGDGWTVDIVKHIFSFI